MEPRLPDHKPTFQETLDNEHKALLKRHDVEHAQHMRNSLMPPKDGVPWSKKFAQITKRQAEELAAHHAKQAEYQKVKDILSGKVFHGKEEVKETLAQKVEVAQLKRETTYLTAGDFDQITAELVKQKAERESAQSRNNEPQETEREKIIREFTEQLTRNHDRGRSR